MPARKTKVSLVNPTTFQHTRFYAFDRWKDLVEETANGRTEVHGQVATLYGTVHCFSSQNTDGSDPYTRLDMYMNGRGWSWLDEAFRGSRTLATVARKWAHWLHCKKGGAA